MKPASPSTAPIRSSLVRRLHERAGAERWHLSEIDFGAALQRSLARRFGEAVPSEREATEYLESLAVGDLGLACACARGSETAWEHFVGQFRPALLAAAAASAPPGVARDLADSIYADLFGLEERDGVRRSLFDYFDGRSTLGGWLRAVLAQRVVDWARASRRFEPLADNVADGPSPAAAELPDVERPRRLALVRAALRAAVGALEARDRLRLSLYYGQQLKLAAVGRVLGESEATVSRKLERTRSDLRVAIGRRLREAHGLGEAEISACFEEAPGDPAFDLARVLPTQGGIETRPNVRASERPTSDPRPSDV